MPAAAPQGRVGLRASRPAAAGAGGWAGGSGRPRGRRQCLWLLRQRWWGLAGLAHHAVLVALALWLLLLLLSLLLLLLLGLGREPLRGPAGDGLEAAVDVRRNVLQHILLHLR